LANFDPATGTMILAKDGSTFDRSLIQPDRNDWAPRFGFSYSTRASWVVRGAYGMFYSHTVRQGREGMLGFNPPFLVDNLILTNAFGPTAVASAAVFRLRDGYPQGLLTPNAILHHSCCVAVRTRTSAVHTSNSSTSVFSAS